MENQTQFNNLNTSITKAMLSVNNAVNQNNKKPPKTPKKKEKDKNKSLSTTNSTIILDDQNQKLTAKSLRDLDKKNTERKNNQKAFNGGRQNLSEPNIEDIAIIRETLAEELDQDDELTAMDLENH